MGTLYEHVCNRHTRRGMLCGHKEGTCFVGTLYEHVYIRHTRRGMLCGHIVGTSLYQAHKRGHV